MDAAYMPLYKTFADAIASIPEEEQLPAYKALTDYFFHDTVPADLPFHAMLIFSMAKPSLDKAKQSHERTAEAREKRWKNREKVKPAKH